MVKITGDFVKTTKHPTFFTSRDNTIYQFETLQMYAVNYSKLWKNILSSQPNDPPFDFVWLNQLSPYSSKAGSSINKKNKNHFI